MSAIHFTNEGVGVLQDGISIKRSSWVLIEQEAFTQDINEYRKRWRKAVLEALIDLRVGCNFSRRACYQHLGVPA